MLSHHSQPEVAGCYQIRNTITNERYIGATINLKHRLKQHIGDMRRGHHTPRMNDSFTAHGEDAFTFEVLATDCDQYARELKEFVYAYIAGETLLNVDAANRARCWLNGNRLSFERVEFSQGMVDASRGTRYLRMLADEMELEAWAKKYSFDLPITTC